MPTLPSLRVGLCALGVLCCLISVPDWATSAHAAKAAANAFGTTSVPDNAAYVKAEVIAPTWHMDPLKVIFSADEAQCRKLYGERWQSGCFASLGSHEAPAKGVALVGDGLPAGEWRWESYDTLAFTPRTPWKPSTPFVVDMRALYVPQRVLLDTRPLKGSTLPLAGQSPKGEMWLDPSATGERAVSFTLRFTAPVGKSLEKAMTVKEQSARSVQKGGVGLGPLQVVWGQDMTTCFVKVPITALPENDTVLNLHVAGVRPLGEVAGRPTLLAGNLQQTVHVPGKKQLFRVKEASLELRITENLHQEYHLLLKTSLHMPAAELLKALQVVELPRLQNPEADVAYDWQAAPVISKDDLKQARPLKATLVRDPGSSGEALQVRIPVTPGAYVFCTLPQGFGPKGYTLAQPWRATFRASSGQPSVNFLQPGHVLTLIPGGDNRLDIVSHGVDVVRWRATRLSPEKLNLLQLINYGNDDKFDYFQVNTDYLGTAVEGSIPVAGGGQNPLASRFSSLPLAELMRGGTGILQIELGGTAGDANVDTKKRFVLATDLGLVSKLLPDGGRQVYVCSLSSGQPMENVLVRILGANGQSVAESRTDAEGHAALPAVRGLAREKAPVALVALRTTIAGTAGTAGAGNAAGATSAEGVTDLAWMALDDSSRRLDYSRMPTQGQKSSADNINAYVFGQRGVFRPGETLHFGVLLRRGNWKPLPADMPLIATLTDSAGRVAMRRNFTVGDGLVELSWASQERSPTGRYRLNVTSPASEDALGSGAVRVEEFQPDTLAIRAEVVVAMGHGPGQGAEQGKSIGKATGKERVKSVQPMPAGWLQTASANGAQGVNGPQGADGEAGEAAIAVYLRNFYGLPAEGRRVRAEFSIKPAQLRFPGFEDFHFPDIMPLNASPMESSPVTTAHALPEVQTTAEGEALVPLPLAAYQKRSMQCTVLVEGFEADGGRAVTTEKTFLVSPLAAMLGYRLSGAVDATDYVPQGAKGGLEFVALGPDARPVDAKKVGKLHFSVAERRYVTVLATDAQGKYVYEESPVDKEISGSTAEFAVNGLLQWAMPTDKPGEYLLTVRDGAKQVMARIPFTVAGNDDVRAALEPKTDTLRSTSMRLRLDKNDYAPGDTVNIFLAAPYEGVGLMTLERDRVAKHVWFKAPAGNSVHKLTIPEDFEGRGYINVTMGRAVSSPEIFMQPHSFAVAPLTVNAAGRNMGLTVQAPAQVLPGSTLKARVSAKHKGKALIFAVDEGVLQLTHFTTPDPLHYLLLDRALEVATDQLFDLLMPTHSQLSKRLPAFGGDMQLGGGRFSNPFKRRSEPPLAWWSGLVDVGPEGMDVNIPVPAYTNGQVRIMAVALSADTTGSAEGNTIARAPLVITPQLPLMAAPGDVFEGGIALHNTTDTPLTVALKTELTGLLPEKTLPEKIDVAAGKEIYLPLRMKAGASPGEASLTVTATPEAVAGKTAAVAAAGQELRPSDTPSDSPSVTRTVALSVRPPVLPRQEQRTGFVANARALPQGTLPAGALKRDLFSFKADATASVSPAPLPPLRVLLRSLAAYPYGCVEQRISRALPLVLLQRRPGMTALLTPAVINGKPRAEEHARMLEGAVSAIRGAFKEYEGLSPWADAASTDTLLTAYAGDYLLLLREAGLSIPGDLAASFFQTLQQRAAMTPDSLAEARALAYGQWVLTRYGHVTTHGISQLRTQLDERWPGWKTDVTATFIAGAYAVMNMHAQAEDLLQAGEQGGLGGALVGNDEGMLTPLAAHALHVTVLARHFPQRLEGKAGALAGLLVEGVDRSYGSTLESALGARALLELAVPVKKPTPTPAPENGNDAHAGMASALAGMELRCTAWQKGFEPALSEGGKAVASDELPLLTLNAPGCAQFSLVGAGLSGPAGPAGKSEKTTAPATSTSLYWDVSSDGYDKQPPTKAAAQGMEVTRTLKLPDGTVLGADAKVAQGTVLRVELTTRVHGNASKADGSAQVVLADLLPGGFELVLTHPDDVIPGDDTMNNYFRLDRREDRVLAHATVGNAPVTFVYHVRAVNRGQYALPAAYGEGLYDRSCNAHTAAGVITVE